MQMRRRRCDNSAIFYRYGCQCLSVPIEGAACNFFPQREISGFKFRYVQKRKESIGKSKHVAFHITVKTKLATRVTFEPFVKD